MNDEDAADLEDMLVVSWLAPRAPGESLKNVVHRLIVDAVRIALDPAVSAEARKLVEDERERCARLCESAPERYDITGGAAEVARALAKEIRASAPATDPEPPA